MRGLLFAAGLLAAVTNAGAEEESLAVQRVKAAFLYKFAAFVEWPENAFPNASSPIVIGIVGSDAVAKELATAAADRKLGSRPVRIQRLGRTDHADACCQILFIGAGSDRQGELLAQARGHPVLTVTEAEGVHPKGSVINFMLVEDRVRFDISRDAADHNGLQLRSQLLAVARQVSS